MQRFSEQLSARFQSFRQPFTRLLHIGVGCGARFAEIVNPRLQSLDLIFVQCGGRGRFIIREIAVFQQLRNSLLHGLALLVQRFKHGLQGDVLLFQSITFGDALG